MLDATYVHHVGDDLSVVNAARVSYGASSPSLSEKDIKLIKYLAAHEHMTPFEHNSLTVLVTCPLFVRSQIHRHRTFSYNEISRRYTHDNLEFFMPAVWRSQDTKNKQGSSGEVEKQWFADETLRIVISECLKAYDTLLQMGVANELARMVLPQNLITKFYMTGNLRNWCHYFKLRLDPHAQEETRVVSKKIYDIAVEKFPVSMEALLGAV